MAEIRYPKQAAELAELLKQSQLTPEQFAERAFLKCETFRKYLGGYMPVGERTMQAIRKMVREEVELLERTAAHFSNAGLKEEAIHYAGKLLRLPEEKQRLAKKLIDELHGEPVSYLKDGGKGKKKRRNVSDQSGSTSLPQSAPPPLVGPPLHEVLGQTSRDKRDGPPQSKKKNA